MTDKDIVKGATDDIVRENKRIELVDITNDPEELSKMRKTKINNLRDGCTPATPFIRPNGCKSIIALGKHCPCQGNMLNQHCCFCGEWDRAWGDE